MNERRKKNLAYIESLNKWGRLWFLRHPIKAYRLCREKREHKQYCALLRSGELWTTNNKWNKI